MFDPVDPKATALFAELLSSLGLPTAVTETPAKVAKPRKVRPPLTDAQKKIVRERFAAGRAKAQAKRDAEEPLKPNLPTSPWSS
jgi:hypothetical protein